MASRRNCCCSIFERLWKFFWQPPTSKRLSEARQRNSQQTELRSCDVLLSCDDHFSLTVDCEYVNVEQILKSDSVSSKLKAILLSDTCGVFKSNSVVSITSKCTLLLLAVGDLYSLQLWIPTGVRSKALFLRGVEWLTGRGWDTGESRQGMDDRELSKSFQAKTDVVELTVEIYNWRSVGLTHVRSHWHSVAHNQTCRANSKLRKNIQ